MFKLLVLLFKIKLYMPIPIYSKCLQKIKGLPWLSLLIEILMTQRHTNQTSNFVEKL